MDFPVWLDFPDNPVLFIVFERQRDCVRCGDFQQTTDNVIAVAGGSFRRMYVS
ncbi:hypothetical protein [Xenorhabdus bovienii]|uniref:hypothetical protein n=1 Tax=Xenorhabdus bovienii TaxID=40576 RepID=UPI003BAD709A